MAKVRWVLVLIVVVWWVVGCASDTHINVPDDVLEPAVAPPAETLRARWITVGSFDELAAAIASGERFIRASAGSYAFSVPLLLENVTLIGDPAGGTVFDAAGVDWGPLPLLEDCQGHVFGTPAQGLLAAQGTVTIENISFEGLTGDRRAYVVTATDAGDGCRFTRRNVSISDSSFSIQLNPGLTFAVALVNVCACDHYCGAETLNLRLEGNSLMGGTYAMVIANVASDASGTEITAYLADNEFSGVLVGFLVHGSSHGSAGTVNLSTRGNRFSAWNYGAFIAAGTDNYVIGPAGGRNGRVNWASWGDRFEDSFLGLGVAGGHRHVLPFIGDSSNNLARAWVLDPVFANNTLRDIEVFGSSTLNYYPQLGRWSANQVDKDNWGPGNTVELTLLGASFAYPDRGGFLQVQHHADFTTRWLEPYLGPPLPDFGNRVILCGPAQRFQAANPGLEIYPDAGFFDPRCRPPSMADIRGRF